MALRGSTVFRAGVLTALAGSLILTPASPAAADDDGGHRKAKNIILLIGDGMGQTHVDATRERYYGAAGRLSMEKLPALGAVKTYAVEEGSDKPELVTDSSSSAT